MFRNISGKSVPVAAALLAASLGAAPAAMADHEVKGTVTDGSTGRQLAGARVTVVDGSAAAMTGDEGRYSITAPSGKVMLRIEAPGFNPVIVPVRDNETLDIRLYTATKGDSFFDSDDLFSATSADSRSEFGIGETAGDQSVADLQGQLFSISRSGMPGAGHAVFVEGLHSINSGSQPLYVVDGVEWSVTESDFQLLSGHYNNPLALIDPKDIESIQVMRNGTAIYGTRGANGVILINTKRARTEATEIEAYAMLGFRERPKSIPVMNGQQYRLYVSDIMSGMFENSSMVNRFGFLNDDPSSVSYAANHNDTDWMDLTTRTGLMMNYGVSVRGGDDRALYGFSLGYAKSDGNVKETSFDRLNVRFNSDINLWKGFKLRFDIAFAQATWNLFSDGIDEVGSPYYLSLIKSPLYHPNVISNKGEVTLKYSDVDELGVGNPLSIIDLGKGDSRNYRFNLNAAPQYRFNDKLMIQGLVGYTFDKIKDNSFLPDYGVEDIALTNSNGEVYATMKNRVQNLMNRHTTFITNIFGEYSPLKGYTNNLDLRLGWRFRNDTYRMGYGEGLNTSSDYMNSMGNTTATLRTTYGYDWKEREMAWYLTADYAFMKRYLIGVSGTMQTSNRFGKHAAGAPVRLGGVSWGLFPSVNAAWILSSEDFMKNLSFIDFAKIRVGWEMTGNGNLPVYANRTYFGSEQFTNSTFGLVIQNIGNDRLTWETTNSFRVGLDMSLFSNRWNFNFDYYNQHTRNLIVRKEMQDVAGLEYFWTNGGRLTNNGVNFATTVRALDLRDWKLDVGAAIGHYVNRVKSLADGSFITDINGAQILTEEGNPLGVFYGYRTEGVLSTSEAASEANLRIRNANGTYTSFQAGDMRFADNGDGIIDEKDRTIIGDPNPDFFGNFNFRLQWKNLTLSTLFTYSYGNDVYNALRASLESGSGIQNQSVALMNRWMVNGQQTDIPRATYGDPMGNSRFSDRWIEDGSYLKWKSIQLTYDIPVRSTFLQGVSVWVAVNNLCTWTKYLGPDPEFYSGVSPLYLGIDNGMTGSSREFNFGVKINL
ncbi:MAG: SusC/RagA family TonB-linked outer membrane protein [Bacteroidales bacterium]|nr:SusC/RagA family TonB-linked outer membrane protein [Bacteroidales bacterium]